MIAVPVIAIFDIGKTNKKFFLINEDYKIVLEQSIQLDEIKDEDGDACEDVNLLTEWVQDTIKKNLRLKRFDIKAINFCTYGASIVYLNEEGKVIAPLYSYLKSFPPKLKKAFYNNYGGEEKISLETASPVLGNLNSGLQLYRLKNEQPEIFDTIKYALHLPQYISYLITKKPAADITSIGCHTHLWNFQTNSYHDWVIKEGIDKKLPAIFSSSEIIEVLIEGHLLKSGVGLHDSSAALIPYLANFREPFILVSTGTWCISFNPFNHQPLTSSELNNDCLCYMEYKGKPVKASRLFAGYEHEMQTKRLSKYFKKPDDFYKSVHYNSSIITGLKDSGILKNKFYFINDISRQFFFEKRELKKFKNYEEAYHCLMHDIMQQQFISTQLIFDGSVKRIFVDGGFSNNSIYMHLLAFAFPRFEVYAASVAQTTAMGAALAIHNFWNPFPVPADMVKLTYYKSNNPG